MKKIFLIYVLLACFSFASCVQEEDTSATSSTESTSAISQSEETTETTLTTETAQTTTSATETTMQTTLGWRDRVEVRETAPIQTEIPELQEKIDYYSNDLDPNKVIVEIGDQRDVPYLFSIEFRTIDGFGGYGGNYISENDISYTKDRYPTYIVTGIEELRLFCNDVLQEDVVICIFNNHSDHDAGGRTSCYAFDYSSYSSLKDAYDDLPKGTYYASVMATCYGDYLLTEYGEPIEADGNPFGRKTEYCHNEAFFILEFQ